jgi:hypothetical protein
MNYRQDMQSYLSPVYRDYSGVYYFHKLLILLKKNELSTQNSLSNNNISNKLLINI